MKAAIGALKNKGLIKISQGKIVFIGKKEDVIKKTLEEQFLQKLPKQLDKLQPQEKYALNTLKNRKNIIEINEKKIINFEITPLGQEILQKPIQKQELIEELTSKIIKSGKWKGKKFRRYDIKSPVPEIFGGKRHFVNQSIEHIRKIWIEMGFQEITGPKTISGFWNFDALFTPQDHPVREMHDTFYIKGIQSKLPNKKLVQNVKLSHEKGVAGSKGWQYNWKEEPAKKVLLRTHTTCLSAQMLAKLGSLKKENKKGKFFAIGKNFRNETLDWSHGFEFYQTEGIVIDKNGNFRQLLGYLTEFYKKMGYKKVRFAPGYFPYTEPSVETQVWHPEKKVWLELGGAGIFRPELTIPLLGEHIPVLAWGQGVDRIIMDYYNIKDLREMYRNNLTQLRKMKVWIK